MYDVIDHWSEPLLYRTPQQITRQRDSSITGFYQDVWRCQRVDLDRMPGLGRQRNIDIFAEPLEEVYKSVNIRKARFSREKKTSKWNCLEAWHKWTGKVVYDSSVYRTWSSSCPLLLLSRSGDKVTLEVREVPKNEGVITLSSDDESDEGAIKESQNDVSNDPDWFEPEVLLIESDRRPVTRSLSRRNDLFKKGLLTSDKDPIVNRSHWWQLRLIVYFSYCSK